MKDAPGKLYCLMNTQYERCLRENVHKEFNVTVHNFHQFEKDEWYKYKLENMCWVSEGNQRAIPERQTEFSSPE